MVAEAAPALQRGDGAGALRAAARLGRRFWAHRGARLGLVLILGWVLAAILAPHVAPYAPDQMIGRARQAPSLAHLMGTDQLGRDVLSRVIWGSRISLKLGFVSVAFGLIPGMVLGLVAGFFGGWVDMVVGRLIDGLLAFPGVILALLIIATLGPGIVNVMIATGLSAIPEYARLTRGSVIATRALPYVEAARVVGNGPWRIMFRHVLPNATGPLIVFATLQVGNAILVGAGMSFLGLGAQPPTAEWGLMSSDGRELLRRAWWISVFPGLAILTVVVGFNLIGDGLRRAFDPKEKDA